jgi:uncharacterized protein with HEPN domain
MKRDDTVFLQHILDAIQRTRQHLRDVSQEQFWQNDLVQDAVIRQLEIIGEASRNLSDDLRSAHSQVPWGQIIGLRNKLIHAYFSVDLSIVWEIVNDDLPALEEQVEYILTSEEI